MKEGKLYTTAGAARAPGGKSNIVRNFYLWCLVAIFSILRFSAKISRSRKKSRFLLMLFREKKSIILVVIL